jgi:YbbR domain-containing protein
VRTRRLFRVLVRNWPLRLGAIALAIVLYLGLVISQNARTWNGPVTIDAIDQPAGTFLLAALGNVTTVQYIAPLDVAAQVTNSSFVATADLAGVGAQPNGAPVTVPVRVVARDQRIQVVSWEPATIVARLDPVIVEQVAVQVYRGAVPPGFTAGQPTASPAKVSVSGASSLVSQVAAALARVAIDPSGANVDTNVDLVAVDARGNVISPVTIQPSSVHVTILVGEQQVNRTLPVVPNVTGNLAQGYDILEVTVTPLTATLSGSGSAMEALTSVPTAPISVDGRTTDLTTMVALQPPKGITVLGSTRVQVRIQVMVETGSRSFGAGVLLTGARSDRTYSLSVPDVLVTLGGSSSALDDADPAGLYVTASVAGLDAGTFTVPVRFTPPPGTSLLAISPSSVQVTVTAPTPSPSPTATSTPGA